jgi:hypothetical protein
MGHIDSTLQITTEDEMSGSHSDIMITVFWNGHRYFAGTNCLHFKYRRAEKGEGKGFVLQFGIHLPNYTASHSKIG